jgi:small subunit ribosomal protein S21
MSVDDARIVARSVACCDIEMLRLRTSMPSEAIQCKPLEVIVSDRGIERAIKMLKRKLASEGVLRELKMRRHYMKPSVKRRKKQAEAARRRRKRAKVEATTPKAT